MPTLHEPCVCCSGKLFKTCCDPFLNKQQHAKTSIQLMRSRYSAYALGGYGDYLIQTWLPGNAPNVSAADLSMRTTRWLDLTILAKSQCGDDACLEFKAMYADCDDEKLFHHEKSVFKRIDGRWYYVNGDIITR